MMAQSRAESTRDTYNYGQYLNQFPPNTIKVIREFERIQKKICKHKMSIMFNEICIYIYRYMCIYIYVYVYLFVCVCAYSLILTYFSHFRKSKRSHHLIILARESKKMNATWIKSENMSAKRKVWKLQYVLFPLGMLLFCPRLLHSFVFITRQLLLFIYFFETKLVLV